MAKDQEAVELECNIMRNQRFHNAPKSPHPRATQSIVSRKSKTTRRTFLATSAVAGLTLAGCTKRVADAPTITRKVRKDVPLRIALCGNDRFAEVMKTAWSGIAEQPLQITLLDPSQILPADWEAKAVQTLKSSDIAVVPVGLVAALSEAGLITPPTENLLGENGVNAETFFPVLRERAMTFGGGPVGIPIGAVQPSLVFRTDATSAKMPTTWDEYVDVAMTLNQDKKEPQVAEPLAAGSAGQMFLWRASDAMPSAWLFDRDTFAPVIDTAPYVEALATMKRCAELYDKKRLTAGEVWQRIASGSLSMAIAWPAAHSDTQRIEEVSECEFAMLPTASGGPIAPVQSLVMYDSPLAVVSSSCRQSDSANRFITWLSGGEGSSMIRASVTGLTELRGSVSLSEVSQENEDDLPASSNDSYRFVLSKKLSSLAIRTPLQLLQYRQYAATLDAAVLSCLDGDTTPQAALTSASSAWTDLTISIGIKRQQKAWRRAQGLSG